MLFSLTIDSVVGDIAKKIAQLRAIEAAKTDEAVAFYNSASAYDLAGDEASREASRAAVLADNFEALLKVPAKEDEDEVTADF